MKYLLVGEPIMYVLAKLSERLLHFRAGGYALVRWLHTGSRRFLTSNRSICYSVFVTNYCLPSCSGVYRRARGRSNVHRGEEGVAVGGGRARGLRELDVGSSSSYLTRQYWCGEWLFHCVSLNSFPTCTAWSHSMDVARLFNVHPWSCGSSLALLSFSTRTEFSNPPLCCYSCVHPFDPIVNLECDLVEPCAKHCLFLAPGGLVTSPMFVNCNFWSWYISVTFAGATTVCTYLPFGSSYFRATLCGTLCSAFVLKLLAAFPEIRNCWEIFPLVVALTTM